jgi:hypothetical protein
MHHANGIIEDHYFFCGAAGKRTMKKGVLRLARHALHETAARHGWVG